MEARQGQDARSAGGLIHDSRAPRATLIQALSVQGELKEEGSDGAITRSPNRQGTHRSTHLTER